MYENRKWTKFKKKLKKCLKTITFMLKLIYLILIVNYCFTLLVYIKPIQQLSGFFLLVQ